LGTPVTSVHGLQKEPFALFRRAVQSNFKSRRGKTRVKHPLTGYSRYTLRILLVKRVRTHRELSLIGSIPHKADPLDVTFD
jgi:hypothetical protein